MNELVDQKDKELNELKKQLFQRIQENKHNQRLQQALFKISELASGKETLELFFHSLHQIISYILYAKNFHVALLNENNQILETIYVVNENKYMESSKKHQINLNASTLENYLFKKNKVLLLDKKKLLELNAKFDEQPNELTANSWLGAPLIIDGKTIGIIIIQSYDQYMIFQPSHKKVFEYIANVMASTLVRKKQKIELEEKFAEKTKKLFKEIEKKKSLQKTENILLQIASLTNSKIALNDFYYKIHQLIGQLIDTENLYVVLKNDFNESFYFVYYADSKDVMSINDLKLLNNNDTKNSLTEYLLRRGEAMLLSEKDICKLIKKEKIIRRGPETVSWLGIPLTIDEKIIGAITLQSYDKNRSFVNSDMQLMKHIEKSVANAIQRKSWQNELEELVNKRTTELAKLNKNLLYQIEEKTKAENLQRTLYEITTLASSVEGSYQFFEQLHKILCRLFYAENFYVALADSEKNNLTIHYARDEKDGQLLENMNFSLEANTLSTILYRTNKPFLLDTKAFNQLVKNYDFELVGSLFKSWLGVTLKDNLKPIGIMVVQSYRNDVIYTDWHRDLLEFVAQHVTIALNKRKAKAYLKEKILERTIELEKEIEHRKESESTQYALYHIANLASMDLDLHCFYQEIHKIISTFLYSENFHIIIKNEKTNDLEIVYYVDSKNGYKASSFENKSNEQFKQSLTSYIIKKRKTLLATSSEIQQLIINEKLKLIDADIVSLLGVPLILNDEVIGVMALQSYLPNYCYTEKNSELMVFVGQHVATAIQRKRNKDFLKNMVEKRTNELNQSNEQLRNQIEISEKSKMLQTALYEITELASGAKTMNSLYCSIHEIILHLIEAENFFICLYDNKKENINFVYYVDAEDDLNIELIKNTSTEKIKKTPVGIVLKTGKSILKTPKNTAEIFKNKEKYIGKKPLYWLGVPLKINNNILGVIATKSYSENKKLGFEEQELLEFVSQHIALTLERKQDQTALENRVAERTSELAETNASLEQQIIERERSELIQSTLYFVSNLANKDISLKSLFFEIHNAIKKLVYAKNFYIALWDYKNEDMDWIYCVDSDHEYDYSCLQNLPKEKRTKSLGRYVVMTKKPLMINRDEIYNMEKQGDVLLMGPVSEYYLGVPLISADKAIGVMAIQSYDKEIFYPESDKELLVFVAQSIMLTIEKHKYQSHLEESVKKRTEELTVSNRLLQKEITQRKQAVELQRALFQISKMPQLCSTEKELYDRLHDIISILMPAKNFYIALSNKEEQYFELKHVIDEHDSGIKTIPFNVGLTGYAYERKEITHINRNDIFELEKQKRLRCIGSYPVDWVGVPLRSGDDILGIMVLQSYDEDYLYEDKEITILNFVSTHIAEALQRKYAEKKLNKAYSELAIKTKKAEEASKAKSTFLATVSHEIRTPMNGILGLLTLLDETSLDFRQSDYVSKISTSAHTLLLIINDILDFSKMEYGKLELENIEFNLLNLLDNLVDLFAGKINEKKIDFNINLSSEVVLERIGDSLRLSQILINLIGNAIKFTDKGFIHVDISEPTLGRLVFSVEDSGIGIDFNKREKIFQSFTQADDATTRRFGGSGLGLSICQQLVSMMGGKIEVTGDIDKGSCFSFQTNITINQNVKKQQYNFKDIGVLLISDSEKQAKSWENIFLRHNIQFKLMSTKQKMIKAIEEQLSKVKILHIFINDVANYKDIEEIKEEYNKKLKFFVLTQSINQTDEMNFLNNNIEIITKPLKVTTLLNQLNTSFLLTSDKKQSIKCQYELLGVKILLVEDNIINQQVAKEILEKSGAKITIVNNGKKAVEIINRNYFDIILMDMQMPVMDGYKATKIIRKKFRSDQLPIIAMTANVMKGDKEKCIKFGMNDYIGKPFVRSLLFNVINNNLINRKKTFVIQNDFEIKDVNYINHKKANINIDVIANKFGSKDFALNLVKMFYQSHVNDCEQINQLIKLKNYSLAEKKVHKIKGSAGDLGMDLLFELAEKLDQQLKQNILPDKKLLSQFNKILTTYLNKIKLMI